MKLANTRSGLVCGLALVAIISQFFRSSISVIAPELIHDLALTPEMLGLAGGMFFLAIGLSQVPVGIAFDRIGPRRTLLLISVFALAGTVVMATATSGRDLIVGRFLMGLGSGASFISSVVLLMRWYPTERVGTMYGRVFALSQLGTLLAATPLAWLSGWFGWQAVFAGSAVALVIVVGAFYWLVRDHPPDRPPAPPLRESLGRTLAGYLEVLRQPGYKRVVAVHMFAYATLATVFGLWAGPYLHDVHGLDGVARGNVLLMMSIAQVAGMLWLVPLERRLNTRKGVIVGAALVVIATLLVLALMAAPPLWLAVSLLVLLSAASTYSPVIIAHAASLTPPALLGRGSATANLGQVTGSFSLPVITGVIAGLFERSGGGYPADAYRWIFACLALGLGTGLAIYAGVRDLKPRPDGGSPGKPH